MKGRGIERESERKILREISQTEKLKRKERLITKIMTRNFEEKLSTEIISRNYYRKLSGEIITGN